MCLCALIITLFLTYFRDFLQGRPDIVKHTSGIEISRCCNGDFSWTYHACIHVNMYVCMYTMLQWQLFMSSTCTHACLYVCMAEVPGHLPMADCLRDCGWVEWFINFITRRAWLRLSRGYSYYNWHCVRNASLHYQDASFHHVRRVSSLQGRVFSPRQTRLFTTKTRLFTTSSLQGRVFSPRQTRLFTTRTAWLRLGYY